MRGERPRIEEIIVVEGRDDTAAILQAVDAVTIETHGFGIRDETWDMIETAYLTKGIIVFTDPDAAGDRIRRRILQRFPRAGEAFLDQLQAEKDGDIGIENASPQSIREALDKAHRAVTTEQRLDGPAVSGGGSNEEGASAGTAADDALAGLAEDSVLAGTAADCRGSGTPEISNADLFRWGLDGVPGAATRRQQLGRKLGIGQATSKTFLRRLNHFGIRREEVEQALSTLE